MHIIISQLIWCCSEFYGRYSVHFSIYSLISQLIWCHSEFCGQYSVLHTYSYCSFQLSSVWTYVRCAHPAAPTNWTRVILFWILLAQIMCALSLLLRHIPPQSVFLLHCHKCFVFPHKLSFQDCTEIYLLLCRHNFIYSWQCTVIGICRQNSPSVIVLSNRIHSKQQI